MLLAQFMEIWASRHLLFSVVYMCQWSFNSNHAFNCYKQKLKLVPFNLAHPVDNEVQDQASAFIFLKCFVSNDIWAQKIRYQLCLMYSFGKNKERKRSGNQLIKIWWKKAIKSKVGMIMKYMINWYLSLCSSSRVLFAIINSHGMFLSFVCFSINSHMLPSVSVNSACHWLITIPLQYFQENTSCYGSSLQKIKVNSVVQPAYYVVYKQHNQHMW